MAGHKANIADNVGVQIVRPAGAPPVEDKPVTLTLIFGNPNNGMTRRMMIQVVKGKPVNVMAGTFPLTVIRED